MLSGQSSTPPPAVPTLLDYVASQRASFAAQPFSAVDGLVLASLVYLRFAGLVPSPEKRGAGISIEALAAPRHRRRLTERVHGADESLALLEALAGSPRFRWLRLSAGIEYVDEILDMEFAAFCVELAPQRRVLVFRGTDTTLRGWREAFSLAYRCPVPAQAMAQAYLARRAAEDGGAFLLCGHSKGGNLALYAALASPETLQRRCLRLYLYDAPGFMEGAFTAAHYAALAPRIEHILPRSAVVGRLLETEHIAPRVVEAASAGLQQHNPFCWQVVADDFVDADGASPFSRVVSHAMDDWLAGLDEGARAQFVDLLFRLLEGASVERLLSGRERLRLDLAGLLRANRQLDAEARRFLRGSLRALARQLLRAELRHGSLATAMWHDREDEQGWETDDGGLSHPE